MLPSLKRERVVLGKGNIMATKLGSVKEGDTLIADGGFDCLPKGGHLVRRDQSGLYLDCAMGRHALEGQVDIWLGGDGNLVGLEKGTAG